MHWEFFDFWERYDVWVDEDNPPQLFRFWVMAWIFGLEADPYRAATPAPQIGIPVWFARIPQAEDDDFAVVCLYRDHASR